MEILRAGPGRSRGNAGSHREARTNGSWHRRIRSASEQSIGRKNGDDVEISGRRGQQRKRSPGALAMVEEVIVSEAELLDGLRKRKTVFADIAAEASVTLQEV